MSHQKLQMSTQVEIARLLDRECKHLRDPSLASQMSNYFKHVHPLYGIKSAKLRHIIRQVQDKHRNEWTAPLLLDTAEMFTCEQHGEQEMLGVYLFGIAFNLKIIQDDSRVLQII
jgi:hypothetical protein